MKKNAIGSISHEAKVVRAEKLAPLLYVEPISTKRLGMHACCTFCNKAPKWFVYEQILGIPYYTVFDRYTDELQAFELEGDRYAR